MTLLQNPILPQPTQAIEIDRAIHQTQMLLETNLDWLTNAYGRAYRHLEKNEKKLYFPEVYVGGEKRSYYRVTPDNDKKGMCFFVVGKEETEDYIRGIKNRLKWEVGIVFWVNLGLINGQLLNTENFTQNLIRDVRNVLTVQGVGLPFGFSLKTVETEFNQIYKEFTLEEKEEYLRTPYSAFRFNLELRMHEDCGAVTYDPTQALLQNLSKAEKLAILSSLDFSDIEVFEALTDEQKTEIQNNI